MSRKHHQLPPVLSRHLPQHHGLAHVIQHLKVLHGQLLENPVGQPLKADNINIHGAVVWMAGHNVLLGLHGELLRNNDKIKLLRVLNRFLNDPVVQTGGLAGA